MSASSPAGGQGGQAEVVAFLESGGLGEPVERVDTHGAVISSAASAPGR